MKKVVVFFIVVILAGCSPQKRLARLLDRFPLEETVDSVFVPGPTVYRDTIVRDTIHGDTVRDEIYVDVPVLLPDTAISLSTSLAHATASLENNRLRLQLIQFDSIWQFQLDSALAEKSDTVRIETSVPYPVIEKTGLFWKHGFLVLAGLIVIGLILLFLLKR